MTTLRDGDGPSIASSSAATPPPLAPPLLPPPRTATIAILFSSLSLDTPTDQKLSPPTAAIIQTPDSSIPPAPLRAPPPAIARPASPTDGDSKRQMPMGSASPPIAPVHAPSLPVAPFRLRRDAQLAAISASLPAAWRHLVTATRPLIRQLGPAVECVLLNVPDGLALISRLRADGLNATLAPYPNRRDWLVADFPAIISLDVLAIAGIAVHSLTATLRRVEHPHARPSFKRLTRIRCDVAALQTLAAPGMPIHVYRPHAPQRRVCIRCGNPGHTPRNCTSPGTCPHCTGAHSFKERTCAVGSPNCRHCASPSHYSNDCPELSTLSFAMTVAQRSSPSPPQRTFASIAAPRSGAPPIACSPPTAAAAAPTLAPGPSLLTTMPPHLAAALKFAQSLGNAARDLEIMLSHGPAGADPLDFIRSSLGSLSLIAAAPAITLRTPSPPAVTEQLPSLFNSPPAAPFVFMHPFTAASTSSPRPIAASPSTVAALEAHRATHRAATRPSSAVPSRIQPSDTPLPLPYSVPAGRKRPASSVSAPPATNGPR